MRMKNARQCIIIVASTRLEKEMSEPIKKLVTNGHIVIDMEQSIIHPYSQAVRKDISV